MENVYFVLGESLIDLVAGPQGDYSPMPGGGPYNFARALALQGVATGYANPFSDDVFGRLLRQTLESSGARHVGRISDRPTSLALVATDESGNPDYTFYREGVADRDLNPESLYALLRQEATGIHTGGLALVPPDIEIALRLLRDFGSRRAFRSVDVNMRPRVARSMGVSNEAYRLAALAAVAEADVVKVSDEDLVNLGLAGDPLDSAQTLLSKNCAVVLLTLGERGAWALTAHERLHQLAVAVPPVDTIGAGDCFFAGFVGWLQKNGVLAHGRVPPSAALRGALRHAASCAAFTIARKGCQPPTWDEAARL